MEKGTIQMKDKQLAEALTAYFEGRENEAEKALESLSGTSENPVVFWTLYMMNALKNWPKADMCLEKKHSLYNKDKEAGNQAFAEVKLLLEFYAEKQVPPAQTFLGAMYSYGWGVKEDEAEAVKWYRKAAEQGFAKAQYSLGFMYETGDGVKGDKAEAVKWYRKAAEQGLVLAQYWLGFMYYYGDGVEEDKAEAVKWGRKAAEQGLAGAQYILGEMYESDHDYKTAYMWYFLASLSGHSRANDELRELGTGGYALVSPSEASEAKTEALRKYHEIRKSYGLE